MVDVALSAQLQQWTFDKSSGGRPDRSDSAAPSPELYDHDTLRIGTSAVDGPHDLGSKDPPYQERYLSSEEDLSPMEADSDDESIHDIEEQVVCSARKMSMSRFEKGKSCDLAVVVSYVSAGRPKMIELQNTSPVNEKTVRSASLALPTVASRRLADQASRLSLIANSLRSQSISPATSLRRPSFRKPSPAQDSSSLRITDSSSSLADSSAASTSSSASDISCRPATATAAPAPQSRTVSRTSSLRVSSPLSPFPLLTPASSGSHSFLSSDPFESSTTSAASPILKSAPHKRLRSISQKLSLARIAISPTTRKWDSRINGRPTSSVPPTPAALPTPTTPKTAPPISMNTSPKNRLRRNSKLIPRGANEREPPFELPPMPPALAEAPGPRSSRLVPRGANERAPMLELPPFPDEESSDPMTEIKTRRVRKRKSLMDLLV